jgi:Mrp family chromosome partitioning ATPase
LEVDRFLWPEATMELSDAATAALDTFAEQLLAGSINGQRRIAVVGASPAAGTTTVALCLARLARTSGATCGLLDANFDQPALAIQLGITEAVGWQAVLAGRERLADVSIASLEDQVTLVPLSDEEVSGEDLTANFRAPLLFSMLADAVDLMVIDGGTVDSGPAVAGTVAAGSVSATSTATTSAAGKVATATTPQQASRLTALVRVAQVDAVYVVYDERSTSPKELAACANRLRAAGITVAGAIANFTANGQNDSSTLGGRFDGASR